MSFKQFLRERAKAPEAVDDPVIETYYVTAIDSTMKIYYNDEEIFNYELDTPCSQLDEPDHGEIESVFEEFTDEEEYDMNYLGYDPEFEYHHYEFYV